jgi:GWxTD domain-containing protein
LRARWLLVALLPFSGCGTSATSQRAAFDLSAVTPAVETYEEADLEHLRFLLTDEEQDRYLEMSSEARRAWMHREWARRDPTPTTPENERKLEHYRRIAFAREHFTIEKEPGWDRRGELLIRYGVPDRRIEEFGEVVEVVGLVPPRETWIYWTRERAFQLEDPRFTGHFVEAFDLDPERVRMSARDVAGARLAELESEGAVAPRAFSDRSEDEEAVMAKRRLQTMLMEGQEALNHAPQDYIHDHGGGSLDYVFDVQNFASATPGFTRVEVDFAFWAQDLGYRPDADGFETAVEIEGAAKTPSYEIVSSQRQVARDRRSSREGREGHLVVDRLAFDLTPGEYRLALSARDSVSGNVGIYTTEAHVLDLESDGVTISDVQRALDVRPAPPGAPFRKGDYQVVPYPLGTFPTGRSVFLYFEAYHLAPTATGRSAYAVEILLEPRVKPAAGWFGGSSKGRLVPGVSTAYEGSSSTDTAVEFLELDPATFTENVYDVTITVTDRVTERSATRSVTFAVQRR